MLGLTGTTALITGGTSGIGLATAELFLRAGARVAVCARRIAPAAVLDRLRAHGDLLAVEADVGDEASVTALVGQVVAWGGAPGVLVNSAATIRRLPLTEESVEGWDEVFATNAWGVFLCCRAVIPLMVERGGGAIVNVASINALRGGPHTPAYNASKGAVTTLTRTLAAVHGPQGVRVNCVLPGFVPTEMNRQLRERMSDEEQRRAAERYPLRRWGEPEDVAWAILFLASDAARWITGAALPVDGGLSAV